MKRCCRFQLWCRLQIILRNIGTARLFCVRIGGGQLLLTYVAGGEGKKATREDFPLVRDENESLAVIEAAGCAPDCVDSQVVLRTEVDSQLALSDALLQQKASVVLCLGRLDIEACGSGQAVDLRKDRFELFGTQ